MFLGMFSFFAQCLILKPKYRIGLAVLGSASPLFATFDLKNALRSTFKLSYPVVKMLGKSDHIPVKNK